MKKSRNFAFLLYPESCNPDWQQILTNLSQKVLWILHDKDVVLDRDTGEIVPKKPHYHVMIMFSTPRSETTAKKICIMCGGNGHLENLISKRGYARYLCHLDDSYKHKYRYDEVHMLGGADYAKIIATDNDIANQDDDTLADIVKYCSDNCIIAYCQLVDYCLTDRRDWLPVLKKNSHMIVSYIKSKYWYNGLN